PDLDRCCRGGNDRCRDDGRPDHGRCPLGLVGPGPRRLRRRGHRRRRACKAVLLRRLLRRILSGVLVLSGRLLRLLRAGLLLQLCGAGILRLRLRAAPILQLPALAVWLPLSRVLSGCGPYLKPTERRLLCERRLFCAPNGSRAVPRLNKFRQINRMMLPRLNRGLAQSGLFRTSQHWNCARHSPTLDARHPPTLKETLLKKTLSTLAAAATVA